MQKQSGWVKSAVCSLVLLLLCPHDRKGGSKSAMDSARHCLKHGVEGCFVLFFQNSSMQTWPYVPLEYGCTTRPQKWQKNDQECCIMMLVQGMVVESKDKHGASMVKWYFSYNSSNQAIFTCAAYFDFANTF